MSACGCGGDAGVSDKGDGSMGAGEGLTGRKNGAGGCSDVGDRVTVTGEEGWEGDARAVVKDDDDDPAVDNSRDSVGIVLGNDADVTAPEAAENSWGWCVDSEDRRNDGVARICAGAGLDVHSQG